MPRALGATLIALALAHGAQATNAANALAPIADEEIGGHLLTVRPTVSFDHGTIRVVGPDGFSLRERLEGVDSFTIDLAEGAQRLEAPQGLGSTPRMDELERLVDGLYKYELVFYLASGERRAQTGRFFVEGGSAISRDAKRSQLGQVRNSLEEARMAQQRIERESLGTDPQQAYTTGDYLFVDDDAGDNETVVLLDNDGAGIPSGYYWGMANDGDSLELGRTTSSSAISYPYLSIGVGGNVGIGTTAPTNRLHIDSASHRAIRVSGTGSADASIGVGSTGFWIYDDDEEFIARFDHTAGSNGFIVDGDGLTVNGRSINLKSSGGESEIIVEQSSLINARRQMFSLENNGPPEFVLRDTSNSTTWKFGTRGQSFEINKGGSGQTEMRLAPGGDLTITGTLSQGSSRTIKRDFEAVDARSILDRVNELPLLEWSYKTSDEGDRHFGPMAEDFHEAFGLGADAERLAPGDAAGIALAAIQGLDREKDEEIAALRAEKDGEIARLERELAELREIVEALR